MEAHDTAVRRRSELSDEVDRLLAEGGVEFGADAETFRADPVPRLLDHDEWQQVATGLRQRVRALEAFVADVYGERRTLAEGIVPERVLRECPHFEPDLVGVEPAGSAWISIAGLDLVRGDDGRLRVLEDNVRTPSGIAYAIAVSDAVARAHGLGATKSPLEDEAPAALRRCLEAAAPSSHGELVLLTDGSDSSAYYEHRRLAELADLTLAEPRDLRRDGDRLRLADGRRVQAIYRRTDGDEVSDRSGRLTPLGELLLEPLRAGSIGMANRLGTGVADDKVVYAYVDDLIRYFVGEEPLLPSVPTWDLRDDDSRIEEVLDRLDELVVKPRDGAGGAGVVVGPSATAEELDRAREEVRADPTSWIAQEAVALSTLPTVAEGRLEPRRVDLRPFVFHDGTELTVPAGGLTRVASTADEAVVNSAHGGGAKATWVVA